MKKLLILILIGWMFISCGAVSTGQRLYWDQDGMRKGPYNYYQYRYDDYYPGIRIYSPTIYIETNRSPSYTKRTSVNTRRTSTNSSTNRSRSKSN